MRNNRKTLSLTLTATFILMALLVTYTTGLMYQSSYSHTYEIANDKAAAVTADIENYLETARSVLWVAADTVDHMVAKGATYEEIVEYITRESAREYTFTLTAAMSTASAGYRRLITILRQETGIKMPRLPEEKLWL